MTNQIVVLSTCASAEEAGKIAHLLVEKRLAACVNFLPGLQSIYHWKGAIESATEVLLIIKSSRELFERLRGELEKVHSYDVPEILALPVVDGSPAYLQWLAGELHA